MLVFLFCIFAVISTSYAGEEAPIGAGNIAIKVDYIDFTDDVIGDVDVDTGLYLGIEGFKEIADNLYLGAEVGYANPKGSVSAFIEDIETELTFIPVELNLKYAVKAASNVVLDIGAGASYSYVEEDASTSNDSASDTDWLLGGQVFIDLNYTIDNFFVGLNGKYQLTEDIEGADYNYNNWRVGGQVGFIF